MTDIIVMPNDEVIEVVKTKQEIAKQKKKDYMRGYMKQYQKERYHNDEDYRKKRIEIATKFGNKTYSKYKEAFNTLNKISIPA